MLLEKRGTSSKKVINEINVVPYVDIMLVLLSDFHGSYATCCTGLRY